MIDIFVYLLLVFIIVYVFCNHSNIRKEELGFIAVAAVMLVYHLHKSKLSRKGSEHFVDIVQTNTTTAGTSTGGNTVNIVLDDKIPINLEEDISAIKDMASVYLTVFNKDSYNGTGVNWNNLIKNDPKTCTGDKSTFYIETAPHFSRSKGIYLGTNKITGPLCNNLGINLQSTFTIFFSCIHGDMGTHNTASEIEFFKMYGNTNNNNALAFFIQKDSLELDEKSNQNAVLMLKWVDDKNEVMCKIRTQDTKFTFKKDVLSMFFIVKQPDLIAVYYTYDGSEDPILLGSSSIDTTQTSSANFSNKELVINRFKNYKGSLFHFGIFKNSLSTDEISLVRNHVTTEYRKNTNAQFLRLADMYSEMQNKLQQLTKCPFNDQAVCAECSVVSNWTDINQIVNAPSSCKAAINTYCMKNKDSSLCKCWDPTYVGYQNESCKLFRSIFSNNKNEIVNNIDQNSLDMIKTKFNLVEKQECPKFATSNVILESCIPDMKANKYIDYNFENMKIKMPTNATINTFKVDRVYPEPIIGDEYPTKIIRMNNDDTYELKRLNDKPKSEGADEIIPNLYKKDPSVNYKDSVIFGASNNTRPAPVSSSASTIQNKSIGEVLANVFLPF